MTITIHPIDASAGAPAYTAQQTRQAWSVLHAGGSGRALGAVSGFRVGTPASVVSVTGTTWTLGPCSAVIDPAASTTQGPYEWATDSNITGSITAADGTNPRKDILYIQVNDASAGDGSGARDANVYYLAGTPAATPSAPALPARSFLVATIDVPKVNAGSPTVALNTARAVAAGAVRPVWSKSERDSLSPYLGLEVRRMDRSQVSPFGVVERHDGSGWHHFGHSEYTFNAAGIPSATVWGTGAMTRDAALSSDDASDLFVTTPGTDRLAVRDTGTYNIHINGVFGTETTGRGFVQIWDGASGVYDRRPLAVGDSAGGASIQGLRLAAGSVLYFACFLTFASGTTTWQGRVRVERSQ
jgi:hypothetical protein